jgi:hypothetical protein
MCFIAAALKLKVKVEKLGRGSEMKVPSAEPKYV